MQTQNLSKMTPWRDRQVGEVAEVGPFPLYAYTRVRYTLYIILLDI